MLYATPRRIFTLPYGNFKFQKVNDSMYTFSLEHIGKDGKDGINVYIKRTAIKGKVQVRAVVGNDGIVNKSTTEDIVLLDGVNLNFVKSLTKCLKLAFNGTGVMRVYGNDKRLLQNYLNNNIKGKEVKFGQHANVYNLPFNKVEGVIKYVTVGKQKKIIVESVKSNVKRMLIKANNYPLVQKGRILNLDTSKVLTFTDLGYEFLTKGDNKRFNRLSSAYKEKIIVEFKDSDVEEKKPCKKTCGSKKPCSSKKDTCKKPTIKPKPKAKPVKAKTRGKKNVSGSNRK